MFWLKWSIDRLTVAHVIVTLARVLKTIVIHTLVSFLIYEFRFLNSVFYVRGNP